MTWLVGLTLALPAVCSAQIYAGAAIGGASLPIGSNGSGFRGMARLFGGYAFSPHVAAEAMTFDLSTPNKRPVDKSTIGAFAVAAVGTLPVQQLGGRSSSFVGVAHFSRETRRDAGVRRQAQSDVTTANV